MLSEALSQPDEVRRGPAGAGDRDHAWDRQIIECEAGSKPRLKQTR
jgi:hypothetical protein